jgi:hypothetical protein
MAIRIKTVPLLRGKLAEAFENRASANLVNKESIDFTKEADNAQKILNKSKIK